MALDTTDLFTTSDITPEIARYVPDFDGGSWELSWLANIAL
ncbi:hypothetical protein [Nocardia sp. NPDC004860]